MKATLKHFRCSPQKVRLVADMVRGKDIEEARQILAFTTKKSSEPLWKLIWSAASNAEQKGKDVDKLFIKTIFVDGGPTMKRWRPRAMGRATPILKRTSHVTVELEAR